MAYTDDAVKAKLSALNETQEGIVTVAQWVMFHRGCATVKSTTEGRFPHCILAAEAVSTAYKGASNDIQQKLRRVVEVWRQRSIFELPIQEAVESRVDGTPAELQPLVPLQVALSKAMVASSGSATAANTEYDKMHDPSVPLPTPPVHAARLSQLLKALANAESLVSEVIKSRTALIDGLEKLLETNRSALSKEQSLATQLSERKLETEGKKREVEDGIMRGLSAENSPSPNVGDPSNGGETVSRPEVEALTPPPVEALTPVGSPKQRPEEGVEDDPQATATFTLAGFTYPAGASVPGADLSSAIHSDIQQDSSNGLYAKKRKVTHGEEDYAQFAAGDLDADVAELLKQEGTAQ
ncbi:hypothetical protein EYZ11_007643 [Aspergillus tanneri]|uniref:CID domain-containing protein n=1 Tax=Aspergillus tanneri TaxID=1220188 RepID=A0A4S3JCR0_9EURO|nr:hypothetical protein EYZ11_007643 [Aspergillus tanneri]